jgi:hypothetical protein
MSTLQPPRLLVLKNLLQPSRRAQEALEEIRTKLPSTPSESIELRGLFVFMIAAVETMFTDTYVYYLHSFPESFDFKDTKFSKDDILAANLAIDLIEQQIEKNAISQAYESFPDLLRSFVKTIGITEPPLDQDLIDRIVEVKETRNLLLHNNLKVNRRYVNKAGRLCRADREGNILPLTQKYVIEGGECLTRLLNDLEDRISAKYASYTKLAALRRLWAYLFDSPIMEFDDFWHTDEKEDRVFALKVSKWEKEISSSEKAFLGVWRAHFNRWENASLDSALMRGLDTEHQRKMLWFIATLADFDVE